MGPLWGKSLSLTKVRSDAPLRASPPRRGSLPITSLFHCFDTRRRAAQRRQSGFAVIFGSDTEKSVSPCEAAMAALAADGGGDGLGGGAVERDDHYHRGGVAANVSRITRGGERLASCRGL